MRLEVPPPNSQKRSGGRARLAWYARRLQVMSPQEVVWRSSDALRQRAWQLRQVPPTATASRVKPKLAQAPRFESPLPAGALDAVPADAREAATALGYSPGAALVRVDLPLALPYIFAGLRVATATVIGLVTVTALIGLGGLGQQITYGFNIAYNTPIIVGLVLSVALAAVADLLLVGAERLLVPWARSRRRAQALG